MFEGQPSKKLKLETSNKQKPKCNSLESAEVSFDDNGLWGEDLNVDDELMQQIESQALSQQRESTKTYQAPSFECNPSCSRDGTLQSTNNYENLLLDLQMKQGEVKNLRNVQDKIEKDFKKQLDAKDEIIEKLKKQLIEKQSEIEFQKVEKFSQTCKSPKSCKPQASTNHSFYERFHFTQSKTLVKDNKIFTFGGQIDKGEILYKLLHSSFNLNFEFNFNETEKENEFTLYLNCCVLQLCRFTSFDKSAATILIKLLISRSHNILLNFLDKMMKKAPREVTDKKSKIITLTRGVRNISPSSTHYSLISSAKCFPKEKGAVVRRTITMLAKLMQIEPIIMKLLIRLDDCFETRYKCHCIERTHSLQSDDVRSINNIFERDKQLNVTMNRKMDDLEKLANHKKMELIFDILELFYKIIQEISVQKKIYKYEGVFSSILYFCSNLCDYGSNVMHEKYLKILNNMIQKVLFLPPGSAVIQYVVEFLSASSHFDLSNLLCHRSAAETFSENFRSFCFTHDTCVLQVLCAHLEICDKSPYFVDKFTFWIVRMTAGSHHIKWMSNETNSKLCECLPTLEQITIRISLYCVEEIHNRDLSFSEKKLLISSIKRCSYIFKKFRWYDVQFNLHIANRLAEYDMLLLHLSEFDDDEITKKFVSKETEILEDVKKHRLKTEVNKKLLITSLLEFTPIINHA